MNLKYSIWQCPICQNQLFEKNHQLNCEANHSFDIAKEGYVNLLLAHQKKSKNPGDSKEMVNARHNFLSQGHYQPLTTAIYEQMQQHLSLDEPIHLFDAGCGEGYYLFEVISQLHAYFANQKSDISVTGSGIDISKFAIQKAAKQTRTKQIDNVNFGVASTFNLPINNQSTHAVIQVFAPSDVNEIYRVLKPGGIYIRVNPAENHLFDMKSMVYDRPEKHQKDQTDLSQFLLLEQSSLSFNINLSNEKERLNLLMMTPFYWTISADKKEKLLQTLHTTVVDFDITVLQKK